MKQTLIILLAVLPLALAQSNSRYHAAKCIAQKRGCTAFVADKTACEPNLAAKRQSKECKELACAWCNLPGRADDFPCTARPVRAICGLGKKRSGKQEPAPPPPPKTKKRESPGKSGGDTATQCTWTGTNKVVVDLGRAPATDGWTRVSRGGYSGLIFEKEKNHGIESAGSQGKMCFKMKVEQSGYYLLTALSSAPHVTEYNDMWINSSEGMKLLRYGEFKENVGKGEWKKAYQNAGGNKMADYIHTVDHNAHSFVLQVGGAFEVCISGRSYRYEVYRIAVWKCGGTDCTMGKQRAKFGGWEASDCV